MSNMRNWLYFMASELIFLRGFSAQVPGGRIPFVLRSICHACFHQLMQYLGGRLRDHAIGTDHFDKPIFQPAQISVRLYHVPAQAGEVCYQQKVNFPSVYRIRVCSHKQRYAIIREWN